MSNGLEFKRATKSQAKLRLAFIGPAGTGKTYSSLKVARHLVGPSGKIAVIDSERGSASKYADSFEFDVLELETHSPEVYVAAITAADAAKYDAIVVDSLSHAWSGKDGALEQVDRHAARDRGNSFGAWRHVTPQHNRLVDSLLGCRAHLFVTLRTKTEYVQEKDERTGKTRVRKIGLAPVQRDGLEYEFDVVGDLDENNTYCVTKTRCSALRQAVIEFPGESLAKTLRGWLTDGTPAVEQPHPIARRIEPTQTAHEDGDALLDSIAAADTLAGLESLVPRLQALSNGSKAEARKLYGERKAALGQRDAREAGAREAP
jgi:hypothetical protein